MTDDLSKLTCLVYDYGLFEEVAVTLAKGFGRMLYYVPTYRSAFPKSSMALIGKGFEGIEHVSSGDGERDFFDIIKQVHCFIFPDIMDGDLQMHLRDLGYPVWGSGHADRLEMNRWKFRQLQLELGMPTPKTEYIVGIDALRKRLKEIQEEVYIKISLWRGDLETYHHHNWKTSEEKIEEWEYKLGPKKDHMIFLIEHKIQGVEVGYDGWSIAGKYPSVCAYGYEEKGAAYIGRIVEDKDLPKALAWSNNKLADTFKEYGLQGNLSLETRIGKDKVPHVIDPCIRCGSPPIEVLLNSYSNWPEIVWEGAHGRLAKPDPLGEYIGLARVCSSEAEQNWVTVDFPDEMRPWIKFRNATYDEDKKKYQVMPAHSDTVASVVAIGDSIAAVKKQIKERAEKIVGPGVRVYTDDLDKAIAASEEGKEYGIEF